jgi:hypothetical protein
MEEYEREVDDICSRAVPRFHYLCRVPGCECNYPETEAEFLANVRAAGLEVVSVG